MAPGESVGVADLPAGGQTEFDGVRGGDAMEHRIEGLDLEFGERAGEARAREPE